MHRNPAQDSRCFAVGPWLPGQITLIPPPASVPLGENRLVTPGLTAFELQRRRVRYGSSMNPFVDPNANGISPMPQIISIGQRSRLRCQTESHDLALPVRCSSSPHATRIAGRKASSEGRA